MITDLPTTDEELLAQFGKALTSRFQKSLRQLVPPENAVSPPSKALNAILSELNDSDRIQAICQNALETFIHDFMALLDESPAFTIVGQLADGKKVELRDLTPDGLHGQQLDWLEANGVGQLMSTRILERIENMSGT